MRLIGLGWVRIMVSEMYGSACQCDCIFFSCLLFCFIKDGHGVENTKEENTSICSLIQMCTLPPAKSDSYWHLNADINAAAFLPI